MECPICLESNDKPTIKLSCGHELHFRCFLSYIIRTDNSIFINCPLCRQMNTNNVRPYKKHEDNLNFLSKRGRCNHKVKNGNRCKKKCSFLNNGYCSVHGHSKFPPQKYKLLCDLFFYVIEAANSWKTKIYMMDIAKKLIIQNSKIKNVIDIQHYFFEYYYFNDKQKIVRSIEGIYDYYNIEPPPDGWYDKCIQGNTIF